MKELPSANIPKRVDMSSALTSEEKAEKVRQAYRDAPPSTTSQLKFLGIDLPFTITTKAQPMSLDREQRQHRQVTLGRSLSILVIAPSNERKTRQILLVHRNRRRRVVHATNLKPCILLVWIALLVFCFG